MSARPGGDEAGGQLGGVGLRRLAEINHARARALKAAGIPHERDRLGKVVVYPEDACGVLIELLE